MLEREAIGTTHQPREASKTLLAKPRDRHSCVLKSRLSSENGGPHCHESAESSKIAVLIGVVSRVWHLLIGGKMSETACGIVRIAYTTVLVVETKTHDAENLLCGSCCRTRWYQQFCDSRVSCSHQWPDDELSSFGCSPKDNTSLSCLLWNNDSRVGGERSSDFSDCLVRPMTPNSQ